MGGDDDDGTQTPLITISFFYNDRTGPIQAAELGESDGDFLC